MRDAVLVVRLRRPREAELRVELLEVGLRADAHRHLACDGERLVVAGTVRITSEIARQKLKKSDPIAAALGIPSSLPIAGALETARIRDGDRVRITGVLSVEMVPELAFHRDAGESNVMRGGSSAVVAIACQEGGA